MLGLKYYPALFSTVPPLLEIGQVQILPAAVVLIQILPAAVVLIQILPAAVVLIQMLLIIAYR